MRLIISLNNNVISFHSSKMTSVEGTSRVLIKIDEVRKIKKSPPNFMIIRNHNWSSEVLGKGLVM